MNGRVGKRIYIAAYILNILLQLLYLSLFIYENLDIENIVRVGNRIVFTLLVFKAICDRKYKIQNMMLGIVLTCIIIIVSLKVNQINYLINFVLLLILIKGIDLESILKIHAIILGLFMLATQIIYVMGGCADIVYSEYTRKRYLLGYTYAAIGPNLFLYFLVIYLFLRKSKVNVIEYTILFVVSYYFYIQTNTKSAYAFTVLAIVLSIIVKILKKYNRKQNGFILIDRYLIFFTAFCPILMSKYYNANGFLRKIDKLLTYRLAMGFNAIARYGYKIWGNDIKWISWVSPGVAADTYNYVDSSLLRLLLEYGEIVFGIIVISFFIMSYEKTHRSIYFSVALLIILGHSIFDGMLLDLLYNPFLLYIPRCISLLMTHKQMDKKQNESYYQIT